MTDTEPVRSSSRMCLRPAREWPHPPHWWASLPPHPKPDDPVDLFAYWCHGGIPHDTRPRAEAR